MLQICCPYCGTRDEAEFCFGGESHIVRPDRLASDEVWADYLFNRNNPNGMQHERWCHSFGCGQWFNLARNTVTHVIHSSYEMGEDAPAELERQVGVGGR